MIVTKKILLLLKCYRCAHRRIYRVRKPVSDSKYKNSIRTLNIPMYTYTCVCVYLYVWKNTNFTENTSAPYVHRKLKPAGILYDYVYYMRIMNTCERVGVFSWHVSFTLQIESARSSCYAFLFSRSG